jgi:hypothetical protein
MGFLDFLGLVAKKMFYGTKGTISERGTISDTDKIIIDYLIQRQNQVDSFYDSIDSKIFQVLTIDGVIFGILAINPDKLSSTISVKFGTFFIIISAIIGILGCRLHKYHLGVPENINEFLPKTNNQLDEPRINELKELLRDSIKENLDSFEKKGKSFDRAVFFLYLGSVMIIIGYSGIIQ